MGVLSEGDLLRGVVNGLTLQSGIEGIVRVDFIYLVDFSFEKARALMLEHNILMIPVLTKDMELLNLVTLKDVFK